MGEIKQSIFIILPCYNEEASIEALVKRIHESCRHINYSIMTVDDGSTDQTAKILTRLQRDFPIVLLRHSRNLGLQAALRTGLEKAVRTVKGSDAIVVMDADQTHNPFYIPAMITNLSKGHDVVVASRYVKGGKQVGVPFHRRVLSRGMSILSRLFFRLPVKDVTSGYRCYRADVFGKIIDKYGPNFIESRGFEVAFELLVKGHKVGAKMTEMPIVLDYSNKKSRSKLGIQRTIYDYLKLMTKLRG